MSDPENFLARWSRRKQQTAQDADAKAADAKADKEQDAETTKPPAEVAPGSGAADHASAAPAAPAFDIASLPSLDSITADSDIRAFLAPGVPLELTRAALRRAWSTDPRIRDFVGLADYDWDFNTPGAITGFGALDMSDALRDELARMVGRSLAAEVAEQSEGASTSRAEEQVAAETSGEFVPEPADAPTQVVTANPAISQDQPAQSYDDPYNPTAVSQREKDFVATQNHDERPDNGKLIVKRAHGRALPK